MTDPSFRASLEARANAAGLGISPATSDQLERYYRLLARWSSKINLTALPLEDYPAATLDRLIIEPLLAADLLATDQDWFDLGSGNGSPAIPLKLVSPSRNLTMVEAKARKSAFLREAVSALALTQTKVLTERIEALPHMYGETADVVTIRAVRLDDEIAQACKSLLRSKGHVVTFGPVVPGPELFRPHDRRTDRTGQLSVTSWQKS